MLCDTVSRWEPDSGAWAPVRGDARPPVFVPLHYGKVWETKDNWKNKTETSCLKSKTLKPLKRLLGSIRHLFAPGFRNQGDCGGFSLSSFPYFFGKSIDLLRRLLIKHLGLLKYDNYKSWTSALNLNYNMKYQNYNVMDNELLLNFSAKFQSWFILNYKIPWPPSRRLSAKIGVDQVLIF